MLGWAVSGLLLGAAVGMAQGGWQQMSAENREVSPEVTAARLQPPVSAQQAVLANSPGSPTLRMLEKLPKVSRAELEGMTAEILAGDDYRWKQLLWDRWIEVDAAAGYEGLISGKFPVGDKKMVYVWAYLGQWSLADPDEAVARMKGLGERDLRVAGKRIAAALSRKRPADFFRLRPELGKGADWEGYTRAAGRSLGEQHPAAAVKLLDDWAGGPEGGARTGLVSALALGWARTDEQAAQAWARGLKDMGDRPKALTGVAQQIAGDRPELAASMLKEAYGFGSGDSGRDQAKVSLALRQVAVDWTARDADAPLKWLSSQFGEAGKTVAHALVADQIPKESAAAVDYLLRHSELLRDKQGALSTRMHQWLPDDAGAGLVKAAEIADPAQRATVESYFLTALASTSPQEAIAAAGQRVTDAAIKQGILTTALGAWASQDLTAASQWLDSQTGGAERDSAIQGFLPIARRAEPDSALYWAAALSIPEDRSNEIVSLIREMGVREVSGVQEKLSGLPIPETEKAGVLEQLKPFFNSQP